MSLQELYTKSLILGVHMVRAMVLVLLCPLGIVALHFEYVGMQINAVLSKILVVTRP